jgi:hypothetical protein
MNGAFQGESFPLLPGHLPFVVSVPRVFQDQVSPIGSYEAVHDRSGMDVEITMLDERSGDV